MIVEEKNAQIESELNRLWLEAGEMSKKWQSEVDECVTGPIGIHPYKSKEKIHNEDGRLINLRTFEKDDDFAAIYSNFQLEFFGWDDRLNAWLLAVPPRFQHRFNEVIAETEGFSEQFDGQYVYVGEVPELLALYDDFYKKKAAVDDLIDKIGSDGWRLKENDDIAFELIQIKNGLDRFLCVKHAGDIYKVHHFRDDSDFEKALVDALSKNDKIRQVGTHASKLQSSISKLKIPQELRKLMIKTSKQTLTVKPQVTYGDLKQANLDDIELIGKLSGSLEKLELA